MAWMSSQDVPADALRDLRTDQNCLSVFEVEDGIDPKRIAIALAAGRDEFTQSEYILFDDSVLDPTDFPIEKLEGTTPDVGINQFHRNINQLTGRKLAVLAEAMSTGTFDFVLKKEVEETIVSSTISGVLDINRLTRKMKEKVEQRR